MYPNAPHPASLNKPSVRKAILRFFSGIDVFRLFGVFVTEFSIFLNYSIMGTLVKKIFIIQKYIKKLNGATH